MGNLYGSRTGWFVTRNGKLIRYSSKLPRRVDGISGIGLSTQNGTFRVTYEPGFYNEFDFDSPEDFLHKAKPCFEKEILRDFGV